MSGKSDNEKKISPFDYSKSILNGSCQIEMGESYVPYLVNRAVAHHRDCIYICQLINEFQVDPEHHYSFLFYEIHKYRRSFEKWVSSKNATENVEDIQIISKYYGCSVEIAREYLKLHSKAEISEIKTLYGGEESGKIKTADKGES
jgi:hypothetical protein